MRAPGAAILLAFALLPLGAQDLPPGALQLSRIKRHVREQLAALHNCTCLETTQRYVKAPGEAGLRPLDTVRLEVLYDGDSEMYASPGATEFTGIDPTEFVGSGSMGTGTFAVYLKVLFVNEQAVIRYRGEEDLAGRVAARYDIRMSPMTSGFTLNLSGATGTVGATGSFWADPRTLDILRLEFHLNDIPLSLPLKEGTILLDYGSVLVGGADLPLPQSAELHLRMTAGEETRNAMEFTHCRSFRAESTLSFEPSAPAPAVLPGVVAGPQAVGMLPPGLRIAVTLAADLTAADTVGSLIQGRVAGDVRQNGRLLVADGALVRGRVRRLERFSGSGSNFVVGLEFTEIETPDSLLRFFADLLQVDAIPGIEWQISTSTLRTRELPAGGRETVFATRTMLLPDLPGVGSFFVRGSQFRLPKGFKLVWRTRSLAATPGG